MALRSLLVPVSGHAADKVTLGVARLLSQKFGAHIAALCIRPDPVDLIRNVAEWSSPALTEDMVATTQRHSTNLRRDARKMFEQWRTTHRLRLAGESGARKVADVSWRDEIGEAGAVLADAARFADLVVMRGLGEHGPVEADAMFESVLFGAGRPALLTPRTLPKSFFGTAMIAWSGEREETHALTASLPILAAMKRVEIRTIGDYPEAKPAALLAYLAHHGIAAKAARIRRGSGSTAELLMAEAGRLKADLLVMGGYHRSRAREAVFGGTTRHIVTRLEIPVLLAH